VSIAFQRHVADAALHAHRVELDCGHVPQMERAEPTNGAIAAFFSQAPALLPPSQRRSRRS